MYIALVCRRAEAELGALGDRALHDLGVDRGGIMYAARYGRGEAPGARTAPAADRGPAIWHPHLESEDT